ncbi:MAG TPA: bifunctional transaldolase/phosoglucose isomerase [Terriglobia bacterium]|nr:bifunctional transaldolase/phosoglucose isomerase [Terriglobia bacterium]
MNALKELGALGQAIWIDYIRRNLITSGDLSRLIDEDGVKGMTSNPSIFEKAIVGGAEYAADLDHLRANPDLDAMAIYEAIAIKDIQSAADVLKSVYDDTHGRDGYVSMEVSPYLAMETESTIREARRLWKAVNRPNLMIKIPGTGPGIPAIRQATSEGININITLLFAQERYEQVAEAFIAGLEEFAAQGGDVRRMASVASFFVSRIDTLVDSTVEQKVSKYIGETEKNLLVSIEGKVAIANARLTYQKYKEIIAGPRWKALEAKGARTQRLLWASTSTKNPKYRDVLYVEELIGPDTVNTVPTNTLEAFRDHGEPRLSLEENVEEAARVMQSLPKVGISMKDVTDKLVEDGVRLFAEAFDKLLAAVDQRVSGKESGGKGGSGKDGHRESLSLDRETHHLPGRLEAQLQVSYNDWQSKGLARRLWSRDAALWTDKDESKWLSWLGITEDQMAHLDPLRTAAEDARPFTHVLLLGMGGSSLCPEVLARTFGHIEGHPELLVLDSMDPAQIRSFERKIDPARTLFIISSKSGSTLEPNVLEKYFFEIAKKAVGEQEAGKRFIAITDPGSQLEKVAQSKGFRKIYFGDPGIGGRYSALSNFGMVPAAVMGVDVSRFLDHADVMVQATSPSVPVQQHPGVVLGGILGLAARAGRDKVTIITSPGISDLGAWLEQLLAESTGKSGTGLIPVDGEQLGSAEVYGADRIFIALTLQSEADPARDRSLDLLEQAGNPVIRITLPSAYDLGQEFFRWEIATAVAGSVIGINPFNQPDVEAAKIATRRLTDAYEKSGKLPDESPLAEDGDIRLYADERNAAELRSAVRSKGSLAAWLVAHLNRLQEGDYFATLAYIEMNDAHERDLQALRHVVRDRKRVATCLGFGPRFQHSTGQAYKGGPNTGVFLQVIGDDGQDLPVPGQKYTFGIIKAAQARGDLQVLAERGRRVLRVHLGADVENGLKVISEAVRQSL